MTVELTTSEDRHQAVITIDRPKKRNALDRAMLERFADVLEQLAGDEDVRVVLLRGKGPAFCAGRDLADPEIEDLAPGAALRKWFNPLIEAIEGLPVPTIAAVRGPALGAGLGIALACDLVVVSETAMMGSPFAKLGGVLDCGGHHFLTERVGLSLARELVFTGRMLSGAEIAEVGLAMRCVPDADLDATVADLAKGIGRGPTRAFAHSKRIFAAGGSLREVLELEADAVEDVKDSVDVREGRRAFLERRSPTFVGS